MNHKKQISHEVNLSVPFHDLDPMHIVWHGNYLKYFDIARFELFSSAGIDLYEFYKKTNYLFPLTKTSTKHIIPLKYNDAFTCKATVIEAQIKIVIDFEIRRPGTSGSDEVCTKGRGEQVAVKYPEMEIMFEIPGEIRKALGY
ncbi:MAG: acyl-CoA thioesterase [Deltaproteobacteria bacterium]|nr:acyl-CoA thioesterase [Deltaproteobacteria bacterium]MBT8374576.1 acyl-CoA thioesterase [Deltaproteobacteria bacterium]